ncbi:class I SAM-dependent methyltransferase [Nocardiopsis sp. CNT-189]|uniref:class I SAM-dependent methyltransferase n=1 Tax=Nocardiopsis oceanisediminis TaxID=2816862 RepID=UPI003B2CDFF4
MTTDTARPEERAAGPAAPRGAGPDARRWPDVARTPAAPVRGRAARLLAGRALARLPVRVEVPGGRAPASGGGPDDPVLVLRRPEAFFARLGRSGLIGFGESYMAGEWDAPDLPGLLEVFARGYDGLVPAALRPLRHIVLPRRPGSERNTAERARSNAGHHYDLSNDLFALFLDETMTYSAAMFDGGPARGPADLARAQRRKIDRLLDGAAVGPGTRLLEIGTGWGELAIRAALRGAEVTTVTLSAEQRALAAERAERAGVGAAVDVRLCDYRAVRGRYDAVVSVEMVEAVGERYWPVFFTALDRLTAPDGRVALQSITMEHGMMRASRNERTWMHKYIFPGGLIPSPTAMREQIDARTALRVTGRTAFGPDYAETLRIWRESFERAADRVERLGFDPVFRRMWRLYLAYCEAGFRAGMIDVEQLTMVREAR